MNQTGKVGFTQAFRDFWKGYVKFKGRTTRSGYWWSMLSLVLFIIVLSIIYAYNEILGYLMMILFSLIIVLPTNAILCRRLQDLGFSFKLSIMLILIYVVAAIIDFKVLYTGLNYSFLIFACFPTDKFKKTPKKVEGYFIK